MKKIIQFLSIIFLVTSCKIQGLTNDYSKLNEDEKKKIIYTYHYHLDKKMLLNN
jgi:metal-responsive CopG/Arc/MetJ family transcriptional regulator